MAITKAELARRLEISPDDLVDRDEAARIISKGSKPLSEESLRIRGHQFPGFYNIAGSITGGEVFYPRAWLLNFKRWRDIRSKDRGPRPEGDMRWGRQDLPEPTAGNAATVTAKTAGLSQAEQALLEEFYRKSPKIVVRDDEALPCVDDSGALRPDDIIFRIVDTSGLSDAEQSMLQEFSGKLETGGAVDDGDFGELVLFLDKPLELTPEITMFLLQSRQLILANAKLAMAGL